MKTIGPDYSKYSTVLFMDSMIALEARPLPDLPWRETDSVGPILILVVPQVNAEIDKRKRDGRLGKRAREFNRIISPAAETALPSRICDGPPLVDIAVAACDRINWDALDDLDPESGDARVVAQILHARGVPKERRVLFSHDTNPIAMAARHELRTQKMPDHWLLELEPSSAEKEAQKLRARIQVLEATAPSLKTEVAFDVSSPLTIVDVKPLTNGQKIEMRRRILRENPAIPQDNGPFRSSITGFDYGYEERYQEYRDILVQRHVDEFSIRLETHCNQIPFTLTIENAGAAQAENLVVALTSTGGTMHTKFRAYRLAGPIAPRPRRGPFYLPSLKMPQIPDRIDRHDVWFADAPNGGPSFELNCADFRQGRIYRLNGVALIDPRTTSPLKISVHVTASNLRGQINATVEQTFAVKTVHADELFNFEGASLIAAYPMQQQYSDALRTKDADWFEFLGSEIDED